MYVRQLASGSQTVSGGNLEFVFALLLHKIAEVADERNITSQDEAAYSNTYLRILQNGTLLVLNEQTSTGTNKLATKYAVFPD